ncbi:alpha/beta hydrolase [Chloroflexi bacterium TSY]|nr:alpha/beta hydrolase [Chloroflexi bacterium TSY]
MNRLIDIYPENGGVQLNVRTWTGERRPFLLVHGLASNSRTWDAVADHLALAGHHVVTVDLRGHGLSDKPDDDYDFVTITQDLARLLRKLKLAQPILVGQSWGGNVVLELGVRFSSLAHGLVLIDGGTIDLQLDPDANWEETRKRLTPPTLEGMTRAQMEKRLRSVHPDWSELGIEGTLANFEILQDGTIRPWLTLDRHMKIVRAMWEQRPSQLYSKIDLPVLICPASHSSRSEWMEIKRQQVAVAEGGLKNCTVHWFEESDHDIHIQKPIALANLMLNHLDKGIFRTP